MMDLANTLLKACSVLGLRIELGFSLSLGNGVNIQTIARLPDLGAPNGMLITTSYDEIKKHLKELNAAGYGFSVLDEPLPNAAHSIAGFQEMFLDWGWSGDPEHQPVWMNEPPTS